MRWVFSVVFPSTMRWVFSVVLPSMSLYYEMGV